MIVGQERFDLSGMSPEQIALLLKTANQELLDRLTPAISGSLKEAVAGIRISGVNSEIEVQDPETLKNIAEAMCKTKVDGGNVVELGKTQEVAGDRKKVESTIALLGDIE